MATRRLASRKLRNWKNLNRSIRNPQQIHQRTASIQKVRISDFYGGYWQCLEENCSDSSISWSVHSQQPYEVSLWLINTTAYFLCTSVAIMIHLFEHSCGISFDFYLYTLHAIFSIYFINKLLSNGQDIDVWCQLRHNASYFSQFRIVSEFFSLKIQSIHHLCRRSVNHSYFSLEVVVWKRKFIRFTIHEGGCQITNSTTER